MRFELIIRLQQREGMEYLLQAICADENITLQNIGLRDTEMSAKGLCNLIPKERRRVRRTKIQI